MEKFAEVGKYVGMVFVSCNFYIFAQPHQMLYIGNLMCSVGLVGTYLDEDERV